MTTYLASIVTLCLRCPVFEVLQFEKCRDLETSIRGHSRSLKVPPLDWPYNYDLLFALLFAPTMAHFWDISLWIVPYLETFVTGNSKFVGNGAIWYAMYDFVFAFNSNCDAPSGGATPGHARSNALAKKLLPWLAPWLTDQPQRRFTFGPSQSSQLMTSLTTVLTWKWPGCLDVLAPPLDAPWFFIDVGAL